MDLTEMVRLLRMSVMGMGTFFEPVFRGLGIAENEFHVLCLLMASESGSESPSELADMVGTSRANMTRILETLTSDGYIARATASRDGRRQVVTINAAGRRKVLETVPRVAKPLQVGFSELTRKEMEQLNTLLRKLIVSFDNSVHALRSAA